MFKLWNIPVKSPVLTKLYLLLIINYLLTGDFYG